MELPEALPASQGVSAEWEKTDEPFAVVDEVICIDVPVGTEDLQVLILRNFLYLLRF